jgi:hypothetical protein
MRTAGEGALQLGEHDVDVNPSLGTRGGEATIAAAAEVNPVLAEDLRALGMFEHDHPR